LEFKGLNGVQIKVNSSLPKDFLKAGELLKNIAE